MKLNKLSSLITLALATGLLAGCNMQDSKSFGDTTDGGGTPGTGGGDGGGVVTECNAGEQLNEATGNCEAVPVTITAVATTSAELLSALASAQDGDAIALDPAGDFTSGIDYLLIDKSITLTSGSEVGATSSATEKAVIEGPVCIDIAPGSDVDIVISDLKFQSVEMAVCGQTVNSSNKTQDSHGIFNVVAGSTKAVVFDNVEFDGQLMVEASDAAVDKRSAWINTRGPVTIKNSTFTNKTAGYTAMVGVNCSSGTPAQLTLEDNDFALVAGENAPGIFLGQWLSDDSDNIKNCGTLTVKNNTFTGWDADYKTIARGSVSAITDFGDFPAFLDGSYATTQEGDANYYAIYHNNNTFEGATDLYQPEEAKPVDCWDGSQATPPEVCPEEPTGASGKYVALYDENTSDAGELRYSLGDSKRIHEQGRASVYIRNGSDQTALLQIYAIDPSIGPKEDVGNIISVRLRENGKLVHRPETTNEWTETGYSVTATDWNKLTVEWDTNAGDTFKLYANDELVGEYERRITQAGVATRYVSVQVGTGNSDTIGNGGTIDLDNLALYSDTAGEEVLWEDDFEGFDVDTDLTAESSTTGYDKSGLTSIVKED